MNKCKLSKMFMRCLSSVLAFSLLLGTIPSNVTASSLLKNKFESSGNTFEYKTIMENTYRDMLLEYADKNYHKSMETIMPSSIIPMMDKDQKASMKTGYQGNQGSVFAWENNEENATWEFNVPSSGLYEIQITYYLNKYGDEAVRSLYIDDKQDFAEMSKVSFYGSWENATDDLLYNNMGDQVRTKQDYMAKWRTISISDSMGFYAEPMKFYFSTGIHKIRLNHTSFELYISDIRLIPPVIIPRYDQVQASYKDNGYKTVDASSGIRFEAEENIIEKSQSSVRTDTDSSTTVSPRSLKYIRMNVMGAWTWKTGNQSVTWKFNVEESGLYTIALRQRQQWNEGLASCRQIAIDGSVPFAEMLSYPFKFNRSWNTDMLSDEQGKPYQFYLYAGDHTITMTVKLGQITEVLQELYKNSILLSNLLTRIMMITSDEPDPNFDYELETKIPDIKNTLYSQVDSMSRMIEKVNKISGQRTSFISSLESCIDSINKLINKPEKIPVNISELQTTQSTLADWYNALQIQPLSLDCIFIGSDEKSLPDLSSNAFIDIISFFQNLYFSFIRDYDNIGGKSVDGTGSTISVWVGRNKEWAETIKSQIDENFTPQTNISINMNIVPAGQLGTGAINALMLAIVSNTAPDVVLASSASSAVELAVRDAVVDLSKLDGYEEFSKNFLDGIMIPFEYNGGIYGLPETMDFSVMFYRKDILTQLGLALPDTWEDVLTKTIPVLYQNNMEMFIPADFSRFLYQFGGEFYKNQGQYTGFDTDEAFKAFKYYCELFTNYDVAVSANFYNRIRTGLMPIGIAGFSMYLQMLVAAPELTGKWGIALCPGTKLDDGTIDRSYAGLSAEADMILAKPATVDNSWEFLKWWLGTDVQLQYAKDLEVTIGSSAKWNPSNKNTYGRLPWDEKDLEIIQKMQQWGKDMPNVLGGYFTGRHLGNAWNRVVISNDSPRDALEIAIEAINKELSSKQKEYGKTYK